MEFDNRQAFRPWCFISGCGRCLSVFMEGLLESFFAHTAISMLSSSLSVSGSVVILICDIMLYCWAHPDLSSPKLFIHREINKNGFHRDIAYHFFFRKDLFMPPENKDEACRLLVEESLPSGVFVDPHQIDSLHGFGGPEVLLLDKIDVEAPEYLSQPVQLYIFAALSQNGDRISSN
ncbi:hypothetical protein ScPMuIL_004580 [Solemya velum]